jgi:hypothetical protein
MLGIIHHIAVGVPSLFTHAVFGELNAALLVLTSTPQAAMWQRNSSRRGRLFSSSARRSVGRCERLTRTWLSPSRCCPALSPFPRTPVSSFLTACWQAKVLGRMWGALTEQDKNRYQQLGEWVGIAVGFRCFACSQGWLTWVSADLLHNQLLHDGSRDGRRT